MDKNNTSKTILKQLLNSEFVFRNEKGEIMEVSPRGSLGLLANGYKGLIAVRKKREQSKS